jgi:hypothetical protein
MATRPMVTTDRHTAQRAAPGGVSGGLLEQLRSTLRGEVIDRQHPAFDEARRVWNGLIDRRPGAIARCAGTADVAAAVQLARLHRPVVSVRGGGHQVAGGAVCNEGLVIDLSAMQGIEVDRPPDAPGHRAGSRGVSSTARPSCTGWSRPAGRSPPPASPASPSGAGWVD